MGDVVPPPGRKGALSTSSPDPRLPTKVDWVKRHRQNSCIHSQLDHKHPPQSLPRHPAPPLPRHSLAVLQRRFHPLHKASTGIQSQALTVPMRTGKHTVSGGTAPLQSPIILRGNKKKRWTPYRRVSSHRLQARSFPVFKNFFKSCPPSCFVCKSLSREISTARCWRH